jgi:hypothetical protein
VALFLVIGFLKAATLLALLQAARRLGYRWTVTTVVLALLLRQSPETSRATP